jgi:hypothetical protein
LTHTQHRNNDHPLGRATEDRARARSRRFKPVEAQEEGLRCGGGSGGKLARVRLPYATSAASWLAGAVLGWWRRAASAVEVEVCGVACGGVVAALSRLDCRGCGPGVPSRERAVGVGCSGCKPAFLLVDMTAAF